jgi:hypothetical protein
VSRQEPDEPSADALPPATAERLLERASRLDVMGADDVPVTRLRTAAAEAGIAPRAFETALEELRAERAPRSSVGVSPGRRTRRWIAGAAVGVALLTAGVLATGWPRSGANTLPAPGTVEEGVVVRCLTPGEAAELVRPLLSDPVSSVQFNPTLAPRVLMLRSTPEKLARAKALLTEQDGAGACAAPAPPTR